jgi:hypothetical protein
MKTPIHERLNTILNDPSANYWLKDSLRSALRRDVMDAANDAEILAEVLSDRCADLTGQKRDISVSKLLAERDAEILRQAQRKIGPGQFREETKRRTNEPL